MRTGITLILGALFLSILAAPGAALRADPDVPIVFASRVFQSEPSDEATAVESAAEGKLMLLRPDGTLQVLVSPDQPGAPLDVTDPDVSYDGTRIVFSGLSPGARAWRIYEVGADGTGLRQVTDTRPANDLSRYGELAKVFAGHDDLDPCYLPDGRICMVSTRAPGLARSGRLRTTNLYVLNADGSDVHRITTERFGADTPSVDPTTGKILYSRWWMTAMAAAPPSGSTNPTTPPAHYGPSNFRSFSPMVLRGIDTNLFEGLNNWFIASINPDGSGMTMVTGSGLNREQTMAHRPVALSDGTIAALFIRSSPRLGLPGEHGLRRYRRGPDVPDTLGGPANFRSRPAAYFYSSMVELPDGRLLVSLYPSTNGADLPLLARNYGLYAQSIGESTTNFPQRLYDDPARAEVDAVVLAPRTRPPQIPDTAGRLQNDQAPRTVEEAKSTHGSFTFLAENIFANAPVDVPMAHAPPIGMDLTIEFFMNPQRDGVESPVRPILVGRQQIGADGRVEMELPAGVPLFEVLRRTDGRLAVGRDGQTFHVGGMNFGVAGDDARCVGCHAGHSQMEVPADPSWTNIAPSAVVSASSSLGDRHRGVATPEALVDRSTDESSEWASGNINGQPDPSPHVLLRWRKPILAREVVVYGPNHHHNGTNPRDRHDQVIHRFTVETFLGQTRQSTQLVERPVVPTGQSVELDSTTPFDSLKVLIQESDVTGSFLGLESVGLAEIEVSGKLAPAIAGLPERGTMAFIRGDADCDSLPNMADALVILNGLYGDGGPICCLAAADADDSGNVNLTDALYILSHFFRGGPPPPPPSRECGRVPAGALSCDLETCP